MSSYNDHQVKTYTATAALEPYIRVKLDAGEVVVAGLNEVAIGVTLARVAAAGLVPVRLLNAFGTCWMTAAAAITSGAAVFGAALGKIDDTGVGPAIGYAEEAATAAGDIIEVLVRGQVPPAAVASANQAVVVPTAVNPAAPTAYAAVVNMTNPVTKTEGEAVSAALATLRSEVATYETAISALVVDVAALNTLIASLRTALITHGIITGAA